MSRWRVRILPASPWLRAGLCAMLLAAASSQPGCTYRRVVRESFSDLRAMADSPSPGNRASGTAGAPGSGRSSAWGGSQSSNAYNALGAPGDQAPAQGASIRIARFTGPQRQGDAAHLMQQLRYDADVTNLWLHEQPDATLVMRGMYASADTARARADLDALHELKIGWSRPASDAVLINLADLEQAKASHPWDLSQHPDMYTLQVGYYDQQFGEDMRDAAEQAVKTLRDEGHEAYFYHGPHRSMITVGLFHRSQAFVRGGDGQDQYSPAVLELQETFPLHLGNGRTLIEKANGQTVGKQRSMLVRVPR